MKPQVHFFSHRADEALLALAIRSVKNHLSEAEIIAWADGSTAAAGQGFFSVDFGRENAVHTGATRIDRQGNLRGIAWVKEQVTFMTHARDSETSYSLKLDSDTLLLRAPHDLEAFRAIMDIPALVTGNAPHRPAMGACQAWTPPALARVHGSLQSLPQWLDDPALTGRGPEDLILATVAADRGMFYPDPGWLAQWDHQAAGEPGSAFFAEEARRVLASGAVACHFGIPGQLPNRETRRRVLAAMDAFLGDSAAI